MLKGDSVLPVTTQPFTYKDFQVTVDYIPGYTETDKEGLTDVEVSLYMDVLPVETMTLHVPKHRLPNLERDLKRVIDIQYYPEPNPEEEE